MPRERFAVDFRRKAATARIVREDLPIAVLRVFKGAGFKYLGELTPLRGDTEFERDRVDLTLDDIRRGGSAAGTTPSQTLLTIACPSVTVCYAGGNNCTLLATHDARATWEGGHRTPPPAWPQMATESR